MFALAGALALLLTACVEDVATDKVEAVVEEAAPAPAERAPAKGKEWTVDMSASKIEALGAKVTATHPIVFPDFDATVTVDAGSLTGLSYTVQMASLEADHPKLTSHLKNEDFFDVAGHPTSSFVSSSIRAGSDVEGMTHTVKGALTIRGTSKEVTFPAKVMRKGKRLEASTEFAIDRKDFGVVYPGRPDDLVQDKVVLTIVLAASAPGA